MEAKGPVHWRTFGRWIGTGVLVALATPLALTLSGALGAALGQPAPAMAPADALRAVAVTGIAAGAGALLLGPLLGRLDLDLHGRAIAATGFFFVVGSALSVIEAIFFTTFVTARNLLALPTLLVGYALAAYVLAWLIRPETRTVSLLAATRRLLQHRPWSSWLWRLPLASALYLPIYFTFGMLIAPIVLPYYDAAGTGLVVPAIGTILALELVRGAIFVLAAWPVIVGWQGSRQSLAVWLGLAIALLGGWIPLLQGAATPGASPIPLAIVPVHGLEITADGMVQGVMMAWLLGRPAPAPPAAPALQPAIPQDAPAAR